MMPTGLETAACPAPQEDKAAAFDFSALGDLSGQAEEADQQFDLHYGTAQDEYLISCIYLAKVHALTAKAGRYGGGTWTKWYESKGLSKSSSWNMVKTGESFNGSTIEQLKCLPELTRKDLNLIARNGCAQQLTEAAGDSEKVQALLEQLHAAEARADTAAAERDAAIADVNGLMEQNTQLRKDYNTTNEDRIAANLQRQKAEAQRDKAEARARDVENQLAGSRKVVEAARLRGDKLKAEVDFLKSQPITAVVDNEEVERRARELADAQVAEFKAQMEQQAGPSEEDGRQAYDSIIMAGRSISSIWMAVKPLISKVSPNTRNFALEQIIRPAKHIIEEAEKCL